MGRDGDEHERVSEGWAGWKDLSGRTSYGEADLCVNAEKYENLGTL